MKWCEDGHKRTYHHSGVCPACQVRKAAEAQVADAQQKALEAREIIRDLEMQIETLERQLCNRSL